MSQDDGLGVIQDNLGDYRIAVRGKVLPQLPAWPFPSRQTNRFDTEGLALASLRRYRNWRELIQMVGGY